MEKRILCIVMLISTLFTFTACVQTNDLLDPSDVKPSEASTEESVVYSPSQFNDAEITIWQYPWNGMGVSSKKLCGNSATQLCNALATLTPTDIKIPAISNQSFSGLSFDLPSEYRGMSWIETDDALYRIDGQSIVYVNRHYGAGILMDAEEAFFKLYTDMLYYYPYDTHYGVYQNGSISWKHLYAAETKIEMTVKEIILSDNGESNSITLSLLSKEDCNIEVRLESQHSDDALFDMLQENTTLEKDTAKDITLTFCGDNKTPYSVYITADNTKIDLQIRP